jgi:phosphoribosylglycinamide formyltransferase-1
MSKELVLAILISGSGSNLQAIIDAIEAGTLNARIATVVSNNPDAYGLQRAIRHGLPVKVINHRDYANRELYDAELRRYLQSVAPDLIVLAGYMRILSVDFVHAFENRILNIHPALLPAYKGLDTHQRALANAEKEHGVSIHLVTAELDDGPVLLQGRYPIESGDSVSDLQTKGHQLEHQMYPTVLRWISDNKLIIDDYGQIHYEQTLLETPLQYSV